MIGRRCEKCSFLATNCRTFNMNYQQSHSFISNIPIRRNDLFCQRMDGLVAGVIRLEARLAAKVRRRQTQRHTLGAGQAR